MRRLFLSAALAVALGAMSPAWAQRAQPDFPQPGFEITPQFGYLVGNELPTR